jgi:L-alanine-DL-glutamate epimerase-like enolase superfamily enzyme
MRIHAVELFTVNVPDRPWAWSDEVFGMPSHRDHPYAFVVMRTDDGVDGVGEVALRDIGLDQVRAAMADWIGLDPLSLSLTQTRHANREASWAFECAILDIRGKVLGCPVYDLLGGAVRERVPVSLCTGYKTVEHTAEDAVWGWEHGFRTYKMKCIVPDQAPGLRERIDYVSDRVEAIHRLVPEMAVRPDIRRRLQEVWAAEELARRLQGHRMDCLEDPITSGAHGGTHSEWRRLRQRIDLPVAEHVDRPKALAMWAAQALDYAIIGGASPADVVRGSALLEDLGLPAWTQSVGLGIINVLTLHICAAAPSFCRPHDIVGLWAKEDDCLLEEFPVVDGTVAVPTGPGLGVSLDPDALARYRVP